MSFIAESGLETEGVSLHALLDGWGFKQKSIRLAVHGRQPRRAWELSGSKLKEIEDQLAREVDEANVVTLSEGNAAKDKELPSPYAANSKQTRTAGGARGLARACREAVDSE